MNLFNWQSVCFSPEYNPHHVATVQTYTSVFLHAKYYDSQHPQLTTKKSSFHFYHKGYSYYHRVWQKNRLKKWFVTQLLQMFVLYIWPLPSCSRQVMDELGQQTVCINHGKFWQQITHICKIICICRPPRRFHVDRTIITSVFQHLKKENVTRTYTSVQSLLG